MPNEIKRKRGTARPDRTPAVAEVTVLPQAEGVPDPPAGLAEAGLDLWRRTWSSGLTWISPASDVAQLEEVCRLADDVAQARGRYRATTEPSDARALVAVSKQLTEGLSALGFTPTARARLGVAEVKRVSKLEQILANRSARHGESAAGS